MPYCIVTIFPKSQEQKSTKVVPDTSPRQSTDLVRRVVGLGALLAPIVLLEGRPRARLHGADPLPPLALSVRRADRAATVALLVVASAFRGRA